jgi:hypothetical protein
VIRHGTTLAGGEPYLKTPIARRTAIKMAAPTTAMTQLMMGGPPMPS